MGDNVVLGSLPPFAAARSWVPLEVGGGGEAIEVSWSVTRARGSWVLHKCPPMAVTATTGKRVQHSTCDPTELTTSSTTDFRIFQLVSFV
jgi:hypothetical protein